MEFSRFFHPTILLALALMAIVVMMILPVPAWVLDIGLAASFALAILMFTTFIHYSMLPLLKTMTRHWGLFAVKELAIKRSGQCKK